MTKILNNTTGMASDRSLDPTVRGFSMNDLTALGNRCDILSHIVKELDLSVCSVLSSLNSEIRDLTEMRDLMSSNGNPLQCNNRGTQTEGNITCVNKINKACQISKSEPIEYDKISKADICFLCDNFQMLEHLASVYDESSGKKGLENNIKKLRPISSDNFSQEICDSCFKKFAAFYLNCPTNSRQKNQEMGDKVRSKKHPSRASRDTDLQVFHVDTGDTPLGSEENGLLQDLSPPKEVPVVRKRGRPRKCVEETPDLSKFDPEHGSGLQVEWLLVNSKPPSQKFTCKRTRLDKPSKLSNALTTSDDSSQKQESIFNCVHCPMSFASKSEAFLHKLTKHSKNVSGVCVQNDKKGKIGASTQDLQDIISITSSVETNNENLTCDLCSFSFKSNSSLFRHKNEVHSSMNNLLTPNLLASQGLSSDKIVHKVHPLLKSVAQFPVSHVTSKVLKADGKINCETDIVATKNCPFCNVYLPNEVFIDKHCEEVHGRYMCSMCEGVFYDKEEHAEHVLSHKSCSLDSHQKECRKSLVDIIYECKHCSQKFSSQGLLLRHQDKPCKQSEFKCDKCGEYFEDENLLMSHMPVHLICDFPFECAKCDRKFPNNDSLKHHQQDHLGDKFICATCGDVFLTSNGLEMHTQEAHKARLPFLCRICGKRYPNEVSLKAHKTIHKKKKGDYTCEICGKVFFLEHNLRRHKVIHPPKQLYKCLLCFKAFNELALLLKHKAVHQFDKSFICMLCMSYFSCLSALQKHRLEEHTYQEIIEARQKRENIAFQGGINARVYQCEVCDKVLRTKQILRHHMLLHNSDKLLKCPHCPHHFASQLHLEKHKCCHGGEASFLCKECGESFPSAKGLAEHKVIHTNDGKFSCHYCGKSFHCQNSLEVHMQSHETEKRFHCPICNRPYKNKFSMLKHFKSKMCQSGGWIEPQSSNGISGSSTVNSDGKSCQAGSNVLVTNEKVEYDIVMDENIVPE